MLPFISSSPEETFEFGVRLGNHLKAGDVLLLTGGLGAGKTLITKGILAGLGYDADEVTSPSFALVNLYRTERFDVYHIDLWRLDPGSDIAFEIGLDEILDQENAVVVIEWAERLGDYPFERDVIRLDIRGDGYEPREIFERRVTPRSSRPFARCSETK